MSQACSHSIKSLETLPMVRCSKVFVSVVCVASVALAEDFKTTEGKEYKNVTVSRIEPDGIVLRTKSGISKLYFVELPKEVQERFHYNVAIATAYSVQQAVNRATLTIGGGGQPSK
jgi:hypothetical protein